MSTTAVVSTQTAICVAFARSFKVWMTLSPFFGKKAPDPWATVKLSNDKFNFVLVPVEAFVAVTLNSAYPPGINPIVGM